MSGLRLCRHARVNINLAKVWADQVLCFWTTMWYRTSLHALSRQAGSLTAFFLINDAVWSPQALNSNSEHVSVSTSAHQCLFFFKCVAFYFDLNCKAVGEVAQLAFNLWWGNPPWGACRGSMPPNCCYMLLEGYMLLLFLYVAYFADLGTVGNNDCSSRSNDVGNFFFLFHIYLLILSHFPWSSSSPFSLYFFYSPPISSVETSCRDS